MTSRIGDDQDVVSVGDEGVQIAGEIVDDLYQSRLAPSLFELLEVQAPIDRRVGVRGESSPRSRCQESSMTARGRAGIRPPDIAASCTALRT